MDFMYICYHSFWLFAACSYFVIQHHVRGICCVVSAGPSFCGCHLERFTLRRRLVVVWKADERSVTRSLGQAVHRTHFRKSTVSSELGAVNKTTPNSRSAALPHRQDYDEGHCGEARQSRSVCATVALTMETVEAYVRVKVNDAVLTVCIFQ